MYLFLLTLLFFILVTSYTFMVFLLEVYSALNLKLILVQVCQVRLLKIAGTLKRIKKWYAQFIIIPSETIVSKRTLHT